MRELNFKTLSLCVVLICVCDVSQAQSPLGPTGGVTPTPTLSPYLDLLRFNGGVLPNYQQFVRPRLQLQQQLRSQSRQLDRQSRALNSINRRLTRPSASGTQTGTAARFLQYSTFYPGLNR